MSRESECLRKRSYRTARSAVLTAQKAFERRGVELRVYHCPHCGQFHLTKRLAVPPQTERTSS